MFINEKCNKEKEVDMKKAPRYHDQNLYSYAHLRRPRGPRFGLIMLIIMAIMSVVIALTVAYVLT